MRNCILVTGATSGIGHALASELAEQGHHVIAVGRRDELLQSLKALSPENIDVVQADVSSESDRKKIIAKIQGQQRLLTHAVHNAAVIQPVERLAKIKLKDYQYQQAVNVEAPLFLTQELLPHMVKGGRFLFVTSGAAFDPWEGIGSYSISKAGIQMLWRALKQEFDSEDIYFAGVRPGGVDTPMVEKICKSSAKIFPAKEEVLERKKAGSLLTPLTSAKFLKAILLNTSNAEFEKSWDINVDADAFAALREEK